MRFAFVSSRSSLRAIGSVLSILSILTILSILGPAPSAHAATFMAYMCGSTDKIMVSDRELSVYHAMAAIRGRGQAAEDRAKRSAMAAAKAACESQSPKPEECDTALCVRFRDEVADAPAPSHAPARARSARRATRAHRSADDDGAEAIRGALGAIEEAKQASRDNDLHAIRQELEKLNSHR